jgi:hypothetical protein
MWVSGITIRHVAEASFCTLMAMSMMVCGRITRLTDMEYIQTSKARNTRASGVMTNRMGKDMKPGLRAQLILEITLIVKNKGRESTLGLTAPLTRGNG